MPDYGVEVDGQAVLVVEDKQSITRRRGQDWDDVVEAEQMRRYMRGSQLVRVASQRQRGAPVRLATRERGAIFREQGRGAADS